MDNGPDSCICGGGEHILSRHINISSWLSVTMCPTQNQINILMAGFHIELKTRSIWISYMLHSNTTVNKMLTVVEIQGGFCSLLCMCAQTACI